MKTTGWLMTAFLSLTMVTMNVQAELKTVEYYQQKAREFNNVLTVPPFETSAEAIGQQVDRIIADANAQGDRIAAATGEATFAGTFGALDDIYHNADAAISRIYVLKETSPDAAIREAGTAAVKKFEDWLVEFQYREDIYQALKAFADQDPNLKGESEKFFRETLRDYRRMGFELPAEQRQELVEMNKRLANMETDFRTNVTNATAALTFTKEQLAGVPEDFLSRPGVKTGEDEYTVMANVTWHYTTIMQNASNGEVRRQLQFARFNLAREPNVPLLQQIVELRSQIARQLGYGSWADYKTEVKMAKDEETVLEFLQQLRERLQLKFQAEMEEYRRLKAEETGDAGAEIHDWDWRYYQNQLMKTRFEVDHEALKVYFPYEQTLQGMFNVYETIFGITIEPIENPNPWQKDVTLHVVTDAKSGEPLGLFYLDMFPREGKFNHFAQFGIISGKRLDDGMYQRPTVALICNFPPPNGEQPSLLTYDQVETLFHEFGHCMHSILTRAEFSRYSGTSVPRDFVEVPSQVLEYWLENKTVLDTFAAHYQDPAQKFPEDALERIIAAERATIGTTYMRQVAFALLDIVLHGQAFMEKHSDVVGTSNRILTESFLPVPENTAFVAYFGHLAGYDAGYYGYAWADVISADLATVFEHAPEGFLDSEVGAQLRREIFEPGYSRDVNESIRAFLGRERRMEPFLKKLGVSGEEG